MSSGFTLSLSGKGGNVVDAGQLRTFLAAVLTPGIDDQIDRLAADFLGRSGSSVSIGIFEYVLVAVSASHLLTLLK